MNSTSPASTFSPAIVEASLVRLQQEQKDVSRPLLSVVIPCHNEQGNLPPLVAGIKDALELSGINYEIVFTDDCSTDDSWRVLNDLAAREIRIRIQRFERNAGQSAGIWAGIRAASGSFIATMDADLQNVPTDLPILLTALASDADCVCGSRVANRKHGDNLIRRFSSWFANGMRNWLTRESISDSGCGYRVFRRECVSNLKFFRGMHRFLPTLIRMEGFKVIEIPITHQPRLSGQSHYGVWGRLFTTTYDVFAIRWMQKRMFRFSIAERVNFENPAPGS